MKTVFSLFFSLVVAVIFCLFLAKSGMLNFKVDELAGQIKSITKQGISQLKTRIGVLQTGDEKASSPVTYKIPSNSSDVPVSTPDKTSSNDSKSFIYARALEFLSTEVNKDGDVENRFAEFLNQELKLTRKEIAKLVRMAFWKNFVTLQREWQAEEIDELSTEFETEKKLKRAGFAARGLILMTTEIQEAEALFSELRRRLKEAATEGGSA